MSIIATSEPGSCAARLGSDAPKSSSFVTVGTLDINDWAAAQYMATGDCRLTQLKGVKVLVSRQDGWFR